MNLISFSNNFGFFFRFCYVWVVVLLKLIDLNCVRCNKACRYRLCVVWFTYLSYIKKKLHLSTRYIIKLSNVEKFWTCRYKSVFCYLVHRKQIFTPRFSRVTSRYHKVSNSVICWCPVNNLTFLVINLYNL